MIEGNLLSLGILCHVRALLFKSKKKSKNNLKTLNLKSIIKTQGYDFRGGPVVRNPAGNAGDVNLIPGRRNKIPHAGRQTSQRQPELPSPSAATKDLPCCS